jgi:ESS family glutamate:Na+ symporter
MLAFGLASVMLLIGMLLRAKILYLRNMLVPASVIGGIIGLLFMNMIEMSNVKIGIDVSSYSNIVNNLFTISFISISLTGASENEAGGIKNMLKGSLGLGIVWCFLYALTPLLSFGIIHILGKKFNMDAIYGMLIQFAFCQGPGQSVAYGTIFESYGWGNATTVAVTLSAIGFIVAFLVGIPMARAGIRKGIAKRSGKLNDAILKGYLSKNEQTGLMVKDTTCNSNIETLSFHFAVIGFCYVLALGIAKILSYIPGFLGTSMSGMMFMNGMYAAYIVKFVMKKMNLDFLLENTLQSKITGWTSDYLVVCAFMAISIKVIQAWAVPIIVVAIFITLVTFGVCVYFGQRFGGDNDFERTLGIYGTCTGTVPTGIALVRIVDPEFKTATSIELGACNLVMLAGTPIYILILGYAAGSIKEGIVLGGLGICALAYIGILKVTGCWGKKTISWK